jgi:pimeloyl-ACP methyl ester carboxylesterase
MKRSSRIPLIVVSLIAVIYLGLVGYAFLPQKTIPINELTSKDDQFVTIDNHSIHYTMQGQGKPLILVHGFGCSTYTWRKLIPLLSDTYTVYAIDLLGFGLSDKPPGGKYDLQSQGELVFKFMDALHIPSATLVGHSIGGPVIGYTALQAPSKVNSLIMISAGFYGQGAPSFLKYLFFPLDRIMAKQFYTKNVRGKSMGRSFYNKSLVTDELIDAYLLPTKTPDAIEALACMMRTVGVRKYEGIAEKLTQPTLIVWGDHDLSNLPADAERLKKEIKNSHLVYVNECGHYVQEEKPEELAQAIKDFLK